MEHKQGKMKWNGLLIATFFSDSQIDGERQRERETEGKSSFKVTEYFLYIRISVNLLKRPIC